MQVEQKITITLKQKYHSLIGYYMAYSQLFPGAEEPKKINYAIEVRKAHGDTIDREKSVSVSVDRSVVIGLYTFMGQQPSRLVDADTSEIKQALAAQLPGAYPDLWAELVTITMQNISETEQLRNLGDEYFMSIQL